MEEYRYSDLVAEHEWSEAVIILYLLVGNGYDEIAGILDSSHFGNPFLGEIYQAVTDLRSEGKAINPVVVSQRMGGKNSSEIRDLVESYSPSLMKAMDIQTIANSVYSNWIKRSLWDISEKIKGDVFGGSDGVDLCDGYISSLKSLVEGVSEEDVDNLGKVYDSLVSETERLYQGESGGIPTGYHYLDDMLYGLRPGHLFIVAARPGMGKTAFAVNLAYNLISKGRGVYFSSLEMTAEEVLARMVSLVTKISSRSLKFRPTFENISELVKVRSNIVSLPLYVDDFSRASVDYLRRKCIPMVKSGKVSVIIVDYLQLMNSARSENRLQEVSKISRDLKLMAKELNVPVVVLSQLSRGVERRDNKRPVLSDLRESGSIEQDSDEVAFLYREEYYLELEGAPESDIFAHRGKAELILSKNRHGRTGVVHMLFDKEIGLFSEA